MDSPTKLFKNAIDTYEPQIEMARFILEKYKEDAIDIDISEVMIDLCYRSDPSAEVLDFLLELGVDINYQCKEFGSTALMYVVQRGKVELSKYFLEHGADQSIINNSGHDVLYYTASGGGGVQALLKSFASDEECKKLKQELTELRYKFNELLDMLNGTSLANSLVNDGEIAIEI